MLWKKSSLKLYSKGGISGRFALAALFIVTCSGLLFCAGEDKQLKEYSQKIKKSKKELTGIQTEISKKETKVKTFKKEEISVRAQLESTVRKLEVLNSELIKARYKIKKQQEAIDALKVKLDFSKKETVYWKEVLAGEVRAAYKQGVGRGQADEYSAGMLLSSEKPADLAKMYKFFHLMTRQKMFVYIQAVKNVREYEATKIKHEAGMETLKRLEKEQQELEKKYLRQKNAKQKLLSSVSQKRAFYEQELSKLRESEVMLSKLIGMIEQKVQETIAQKEEKRLMALKMSKKRGLLSWPLEGEPQDLKKNVTAKFGRQKHPELDTWIINNGIRIRSSLGQNVLAVDKGTVVFAGDFKSYGNVVIIDHSGGFYTVYGNMEKILVKNNQSVEKGSLLGLVGISVLTQDASLYFELRKDSTPQNPLLWLK